MKSLERRFRKIEKRNPGFSSYLCFSEAIRKRNFNPQTVRRWFYKLVDKDDYSRSDVKTLLNQLKGSSKSS